jgi:hypothetical protein
VNNDGLIDLYITNVGPNVLYRNAGNGRLRRGAERRRRRLRPVEHELRLRRLRIATAI